MHKAILGLDVGTSSVKAALFGLDGAELAFAVSAPYQLLTPLPGWVELDPETLWEALVKTIRAVLDRASERGTFQVMALAMAVQSGSLVPARENGEPVSTIITWMDGRSRDLVERWRAEGIDTRVRPVNGWPLYPGQCLPTIAWLKQNDPGLFTAARRWLSVNDWLAFRLTGEYGTNPSNAGGMQLVDIHTGGWSPALCELAGITLEQLSPIGPAGGVIGWITPEAGATTGLAAGTPVINGGHDQVCAALGLGLDTGKVFLSCGTAWVISGITTTPEVDLLPPALSLNFHALPDKWVLSQSLGGLGAALEWWLNQAYCGLTAHERYGVLDDELAETQPGCDGLFFVPISGGHVEPATPRRGGFAGLQLGHKRADMARAIMESAAYELRWALDGIVRAGIPIERLWMVGGAARSSVWPAVLADVSGIPVLLPDYDNWPALGAAILAGYGAGFFETLQKGQACFQKPVHFIEPKITNSYNNNFSVYQQLFRNHFGILNEEISH